MPLRLPDRLPAIELLKHENIFVMDDSRAHMQDIRPLKIAILNLMPLKITTETDLIRLLSNTPLQLEVSFMKLKSHTPKNTPIEHMMMFYRDFEQMRHEKYDGMIITGAPVEQLEYEDVSYWAEVTDIFAWARTHVTSTLYICWAAQAGLYYHYGIPKYPLPKKMFGIFPQYTLNPQLPIFRGFDDVFQMPHRPIPTSSSSPSRPTVASAWSWRVVVASSSSQVTWSMRQTPSTRSIVATRIRATMSTCPSTTIRTTTPHKVRR